MSDSENRPWKLTDVVELVTAKATNNKAPDAVYIGLEHIAAGEPRLIGEARASDSISTNGVFRPGDVLFGKLRPNLRKVYQPDTRGYCSTDILVLRAREGVDARFAGWLLQSEAVLRMAESTAVGTGMPRTSWSHVAGMNVRVPGIPEQAAIARVLDTADEAIEKTSRLIRHLQQAKAGMLHDLLSRGIDEEGQLRDPASYPGQFHETELGLLPRDWAVKRLGALVDSRRPIIYGILMPGYGFAGGVPVVKVKDIRGGRILEDGLLLTDPKIHEAYSRSHLQAGDILFTIRGTIGRLAVVPPRLDGANITQDTARIGIVGAVPRYVLHYLGSTAVADFIDLHKVGQAVKGLNLRDLRVLPVPAPPEEEQVRIAAALDAMDLRIGRELSMLGEARRLKSGLMDDLLTGRVRVPEAVTA